MDTVSGVNASPEELDEQVVEVGPVDEDVPTPVDRLPDLVDKKVYAFEVAEVLGAPDYHDRLVAYRVSERREVVVTAFMDRLAEAWRTLPRASALDPQDRFSVTVQRLKGGTLHAEIDSPGAPTLLLRVTEPTVW